MSKDMHWLERAQVLNWLPHGWNSGKDPEPSPLLTTLVFIGALLCSVPLLGFLGLGLGEMLIRSDVGYVAGALAVGAALWWLHRTRHIFAACIALELWGVGMALILVRWLSHSAGDRLDLLLASVFFTLVLALSARFIAALWIVRLMGLLAAMSLLLGLTLGFQVLGAGSSWALLLSFLVLPVLALLWGIWCWREQRWLGLPGAARWAAFADGFAVGVLLCQLAESIGAYSPSTMLLFGAFDLDTPPGTLLLMTPRIVAVFMVLGSCWLLKRRWGGVDRNADARVWMPFWLVTCAGLIVASWFSPGVGTLAVVAAMSAASARWRLLVTCGLAALALLSAFYYNVGWTLVSKGLGLMAAGTIAALVLGLVTWQSKGTNEAGAAPSSERTSSRHGAVWIVLGALLALGVANTDIWRKENIIAKGERVLVPLVPVDPRSLMQGDYMALRFAIPDDMLTALDASAGYSLKKEAIAVATIQSDGKAELKRLAQPDETLGTAEIFLPLKQLKGQWVLVTDAYFFPEGEGARFERARYGDFRALPNGGALLVGLADEQGRAIAVHASATNHGQ